MAATEPYAMTTAGMEHPEDGVAGKPILAVGQRIDCRKTGGCRIELLVRTDDPGRIAARREAGRLGPGTEELVVREQNLCRKHTRVHAYNSFIWCDWMRTYTEDPELLAADIREGASFLDYFRRYTAPFRYLIDVHQSVLKTATEQAALPTLEWRAGPIAILVMDFAHDRASNEAMWRVFSPSFQSGSTIVIFNQYRKYPGRRGSRIFRDKAGELVPLHKPRSAAKAFRYQKAVA